MKSTEHKFRSCRGMITETTWYVGRTLEEFVNHSPAMGLSVIYEFFSCSSTSGVGYQSINRIETCGLLLNNLLYGSTKAAVVPDLTAVFSYPFTQMCLKCGDGLICFHLTFDLLILEVTVGE